MANNSKFIYLTFRPSKQHTLIRKFGEKKATSLLIILHKKSANKLDNNIGNEKIIVDLR